MGLASLSVDEHVLVCCTDMSMELMMWVCTCFEYLVTCDTRMDAVQAHIAVN